MRVYKRGVRHNISGERIREARKKLGISQYILAAKLQLEGLDLGKNCVSDIEVGRRKVKDYELVAIAKVLNVTIEWLLSGE